MENISENAIGNEGNDGIQNANIGVGNPSEKIESMQNESSAQVGKTISMDASDDVVEQLIGQQDSQKRKRGRPLGSKNKTTTDKENFVSEEDKTKYTEMGKQLNQLVPMTLVQILGEGMKPSEFESSTMEQAWIDFCIEYKIAKFPAWLGLAIAISIYAVPKLSDETVKARLNLISTKIFGAKQNVKKIETTTI